MNVCVLRRGQGLGRPVSCELDLEFWMTCGWTIGFPHPAQEGATVTLHRLVCSWRRSGLKEALLGSAAVRPRLKFEDHMSGGSWARPTWTLLPSAPQGRHTRGRQQTSPRQGLSPFPPSEEQG